MAITIREVAARAGVAVGTVSRVINGRPGVKLVSRQRVERAIRELGYRPNARAQNFARNTSPIVCFVLSNRDMLHPFHSRILNGAAKQCDESGYFVVYSMFHYKPDTPSNELVLPRILRTHGIADSLILAGTNYTNLFEALEEVGIPYVSLANNIVSDQKTKPVDRVRFDEERGAYEATRYLMDLGHREIWYIGDISQPWYNNRYRGYLQAMQEGGLIPQAQTTALSDDRFLNGLRSTEIILEQHAPVTAIFAGTDDVAYGAYEALSRRSLQVPKQMSLVGFDDQAGPFRRIELTTVRVEAEEIGRQLAKMAIAKIQAGSQSLPEVVVPTRLIKRGTCEPILSQIPRYGQQTG